MKPHMRHANFLQLPLVDGTATEVLVGVKVLGVHQVILSRGTLQVTIVAI